MAIVLSYGCRQEENVTETPSPYQTHPEPLRVGAQLPEHWRTHPLAEALTVAEIVYCRAAVEFQRARARLEVTEREHEEAEAAIDPAITAVVQASADVDRAREALTAAMAEGEANGGD